MVYRTQLLDVFNLGVTEGRADFALIGAVYNEFQNSNAARNSTAAYKCATGNCTWPIYTSAAVCSSCVDISNHLVRRADSGTDGTSFDPPSNTLIDANYTSFELPYAHLSNYDVSQASEDKTDGQPLFTAVIVANATNVPQETISFQDMETLLVSLAIIEGSDDWRRGKIPWKDSEPLATECALYLCANAYESRVRDGRLEGRTVRSWSQRDPASWKLALARGCKDDTECFEQNFRSVEAWDNEKNRMNTLWSDVVERTDLRLVVPSEESVDLPENILKGFAFTYGTVYSTMSFLKDFTSVSKGVETKQMAFPSYDITGMPALIDLLSNSTNLTTTFDSVAKSMTNQIRDMGQDPHPGTLQQWVIHVRVDWAFLTFPLIMVLAGVFYVVLAIVESTPLRLPAWKESVLPTLVYGFDDATQQRLRKAHSNPKTAKALRKFTIGFGNEERLKLTV